MVVAPRTSKSGARSEEMPSIHACALLTSAECPTLAMEECSKGLEFSFDTWICVVNISIWVLFQATKHTCSLDFPPLYMVNQAMLGSKATTLTWYLRQRSWPTNLWWQRQESMHSCFLWYLRQRSWSTNLFGDNKDKRACIRVSYLKVQRDEHVNVLWSDSILLKGARASNLNHA